MSTSGWITKTVKYITMRAREFISEAKKHISPSGVETNMSPKDDDYEINYGKNGGVAKFRKAQGLDVKTGNEKVDKDVEEWKASRKLCTSTKPDSELGASALSSCVSQGFRARDTEKKFTINKKRQKVKGKKVKGGNYGGPLPVWKGNQ